MKDKQLSDEIRRSAAELDKAIQNKDIELILSCFSNDCQIELLGIKLAGKEGARRWIDWVYKHISEVKFIPVTVMIDGNIFFEEFILKGKLHNGIEVESRQAEALTYEGNRVKSLRLYFDRLDFANSVTRGFIGKAIVRQLVKTSLKGLM